MRKLLVWDFHGTLEKGNEFAALEISNLALQKHGFKQRFTPKHAVMLYGKKWYEYFEFLLPNETHETHVMLQQTSFEWPTAEIIVAKHMQPNDHAREVLMAVQKSGHIQIVISNTSTKALPIFLRLAGIDDLFDDTTAFAVMGHTREVKRSKKHVVQDFLNKLGYAPEIIVIGDSEKDMLLAQDLGALGLWYRHPHHPMPKAVQYNQQLTTITDLREVIKSL